MLVLNRRCIAGAAGLQTLGMDLESLPSHLVNSFVEAFGAEGQAERLIQLQSGVAPQKTKSLDTSAKSCEWHPCTGICIFCSRLPHEAAGTWFDHTDGCSWS